jgi:hypothetical protein
MARIPNEEIERLKSEVSVERLAAARGIELNEAASRHSPRTVRGA